MSHAEMALLPDSVQNPVLNCELAHCCLTQKRPNYLAQYKNPCFVDWSVDLQRLRCLPYFHVLGVDKSGTTDLHSRIAQHPHVLLNSGALGKETYYWCWLKYGQCREYMGRQLHMLGYLRGIPWVKRNDCWCWLKYGEFWGMSC